MRIDVGGTPKRSSKRTIGRVTQSTAGILLLVGAACQQLSNMLPTSAMNDLRNVPRCHLIAFGDGPPGFTAGICGPNLHHVGFGEPCGWMPLSESIALLSYAVLNVIVIRTQEKMVRVYAGGNIAPMQNLHAFGNWPVMQFPGGSVCVYPARSCPVSRNSAITIFTGDSDPKPTIVRLVHVPPENFGNCLAMSIAAAFSRAIFSSGIGGWDKHASAV
jgi:hypothetical protein